MQRFFCSKYLIIITRVDSPLLEGCHLLVNDGVF